MITISFSGRQCSQIKEALTCAFCSTLEHSELIQSAPSFTLHFLKAVMCRGAPSAYHCGALMTISPAQLLCVPVSLWHSGQPPGLSCLQHVCCPHSEGWLSLRGCIFFLSSLLFSTHFLNSKAIYAECCKNHPVHCYPGNPCDCSLSL